MKIVIAGAGNIGKQLAKRFNYLNNDVVFIEIDKDKANYASEHFDSIVISGSCTSFDILKNAQVDKCDVFAALTRNDETNLLACQIAKKMGANTTICRVKNIQYVSPNFVLSKEDLGVDFLVHPEQESAKAIIRLIKLASSTDSIEFENGKIHFTGLRLDSSAKILRQPLSEIGEEFSHIPMRIVAIKRGFRTIIPRGSDYLMKGDQIFFICENGYFNEALKIFGKVNVKINDIMIIGGGQIAYFIASELEKQLNIKIFELNTDKANQLANSLKNTLVINSDGSDLDSLVIEGLTDMDEFIAVTSDDETNIITSIIAKHLKVPRKISLISKSEYLTLASPLGLDAVVSKEQITVNTIESFIKRQVISNVAEIPGVDAEIIVFIAKENSKITRKKLKHISFPRNVIVGAILNENNELIIPRGETIVQSGDRVLIFTFPESIKAVEKLF